MLDALGDGKPRDRETTASRAKGGLLVSGGFVALLFAIEVFNMLTLHSLNRTFGLRPRSVDGLLDIFTFPLLHANLNHLLSNALPLMVFGFLVFLSGVRVFLTALAFSWLGSGLTVWLIGDGGMGLGLMLAYAGGCRVSRWRDGRPWSYKPVSTVGLTHSGGWVYVPADGTRYKYRACVSS